MQTIYVLVHRATGRMYGRGCRDWDEISKAHCYTDEVDADQTREAMPNAADYEVMASVAFLGPIPDSYPRGAA